MLQNSHTVVRTARRLLSIMAAGGITVFAILIPAPAFAAPVAGSPSSAHAPKASAQPAASSGAVTARMPGTKILCTSYWAWQANNYLQNGGYTQVEWTNNPCGYTIQERTWCNAGGGSGGWQTSGIVLHNNIWAKTSCTPILTYASRGEVHFNYQDGNGWTTYQTFWTG